MPAASITVVLARAEEGEVRMDEFALPPGATLAQALEEAVRRRIIAAADLAGNAVAVFGRRRDPDEVLHDGDRIELLGPLSVDPKEARQRRVAHRRAAAPKDRWRAG
jgi:putative ubiquitin-RnfH superfamily antitoxin RatB of RatAB toxin-antitoxin module